MPPVGDPHGNQQCQLTTDGISPGFFRAARGARLSIRGMAD
jgi:hypothetical protein